MITAVAPNIYQTNVGLVVLLGGSYDPNDEQSIADKILEALNSANDDMDEPINAVPYTAEML
tara:strand:- start:552 stop:737 length:186 start_codon:yes stop_codon:yes gene_type:complete